MIKLEMAVLRKYLEDDVSLQDQYNKILEEDREFDEELFKDNVDVGKMITEGLDAIQARVTLMVKILALHFDIDSACEVFMGYNHDHVEKMTKRYGEDNV